MVRTSRKFPNEWEKYQPVGRLIENTRIFAFKTPLILDLQKRIYKDNRFTTIDLFRKVAENGYTLGLVINLNNTNRYYNRADIEGMTIAYKEIPCPGRGFLNRSDFVKSFCKTIDEFLEENKDNNNIIGVHCTNGVNRSGYLICRYLIDSLGWSSHDALNAFEVARGYPIERGSFVQSLHKADRENRLRGRRTNEQEPANEVNDLKTERKKKKKKKNLINQEISGLDTTLTAQMMQQFFQMEQQLKDAAENAFPTSNASSGLFTQIPRVSSYQTSIQPTISNESVVSRHQHLYQKSFDQLVSESTRNIQYQQPAVITNSEFEVEETVATERVINYESMGKVDIREVSASEERRTRRKRLNNQYNVMKRGRFWEINEMRKDMGL